MKRYIKASMLANEFERYLDILEGYHLKEDERYGVYNILDKYGDDTVPTSVVFDRATPEEQQKMFDSLRPSTEDTSHTFYFDVLSGDRRSSQYRQGALDMLNYLMKDGYIDEREWYR